MLIRFIVSNFLSFKEETEFNMLAGVDQKHHKEHIYRRNSLDLLKTAALYGANGAGKSNLIKAINLLKQIVLTGGKESLLQIKKYKLESEYHSLPTSFEIEFIKNNIPYLYGIKFQNEGILEEWLCISGLGKIADEVLFYRTKINGVFEIKFSKNYSLTEQGQFNLEFIQKNLVDNYTPLINILSNLKEDFGEVKSSFDWFRQNLTVIFPHTELGATLVASLIQSNEVDTFAKKIIPSFNTGILSINIKSVPFEDFIGKTGSGNQENIKRELEKQNMVAFKLEEGSEGIVAMLEDEKIVIKIFVGDHKNSRNESVEFFLGEESDGTNRLLEFVPLLFKYINSESVILIDEIDQSIHPVLLKELVKKFVSDEDSKGQFIFTTHEANLLDQSIFRRDEIWFVEKDHGETKLYPLSDFDIRYDLDIRKGYLNGRFGAIPFMGDLQNLNWDKYAEAE